mmetsp:Transcript_12585/g.43473  ORF Transcript_12585/g.43473 Transcript_12585/m.43473 type:complete len:213 (+) Transcript_12585:281-919(+)
MTSPKARSLASFQVTRLRRYCASFCDGGLWRISDSLRNWTIATSNDNPSDTMAEAGMVYNSTFVNATAVIGDVFFAARTASSPKTWPVPRTPTSIGVVAAAGSEASQSRQFRWITQMPGGSSVYVAPRARGRAATSSTALRSSTTPALMIESSGTAQSAWRSTECASNFFTTTCFAMSWTLAGDQLEKMGHAASLCSWSRTSIKSCASVISM